MPSVLKNSGFSIGGPLPSHGWSPEVYLPEIRRLLRENTWLHQVTTEPPGGRQALKHKGCELVITLEPDVKSLPYVEGKPFKTQNPKSREIRFKPERMRYVQVGSTVLQRYFSRFGDPKQLFMDSGASDQVIKEQREFIAFHISKVPALNKGALASLSDGPQIGFAGAVSGAYEMGTPERPVALFKNRDDMTAASSSTCPKALAVDLLSETESVINENPLRTDNIKGLDYLEASTYNDRWIAMAEWIAKRAQLSDKVVDASPENNNYFFRNIGELDGKIGGYNKGFRSNLFTPYVTTGVSGGAPAGTKSWPVLFGRKCGIAFTREFVENQTNIRSQQVEGSVDRRMTLYDFYALYPVYLGVAWVTSNPYTLES